MAFCDADIIELVKDLFVNNPQFGPTIATFILLVLMCIFMKEKSEIAAKLVGAIFIWILSLYSVRFVTMFIQSEDANKLKNPNKPMWHILSFVAVYVFFFMSFMFSYISLFYFLGFMFILVTAIDTRFISKIVQKEVMDETTGELTMKDFRVWFSNKNTLYDEWSKAWYSKVFLAIAVITFGIIAKGIYSKNEAGGIEPDVKHPYNMMNPNVMFAFMKSDNGDLSKTSILYFLLAGIVLMMIIGSISYLTWKDEYQDHKADESTEPNPFDKRLQNALIFVTFVLRICLLLVFFGAWSALKTKIFGSQ